MASRVLALGGLAAALGGEDLAIERDIGGAQHLRLTDGAAGAATRRCGLAGCTGCMAGARRARRERDAVLRQGRAAERKRQSKCQRDPHRGSFDS